MAHTFAHLLFSDPVSGVTGQLRCNLSHRIIPNTFIKTVKRIPAQNQRTCRSRRCRSVDASLRSTSAIKHNIQLTHFHCECERVTLRSVAGNVVGFWIPLLEIHGIFLTHILNINKKIKFHSFRWPRWATSAGRNVAKMYVIENTHFYFNKKTISE